MIRDTKNPVLIPEFKYKALIAHSFATLINFIEQQPVLKRTMKKYAHQLLGEKKASASPQTHIFSSAFPKMNSRFLTPQKPENVPVLKLNM